jgi:uncharacterized protein
MPHLDNDIIIAQTKKWIIDVVVGCSFCPFAAKEVKRGSIHYEVLQDATAKTILETTIKMFQQLNENKNIETSLLILQNRFEIFTSYLDMVEKAEKLLEKEGYEGIYQIASFHPQYLFAGSTNVDPSNYTNRSPYPMLHFLREESVSRAVDTHPNIDDVPEQNIAFTQEKGLHYMQELLLGCMA